MWEMVLTVLREMWRVGKKGNSKGNVGFRQAAG
jgi:hypothetical protein